MREMNRTAIMIALIAAASFARCQAESPRETFHAVSSPKGASQPAPEFRTSKDLLDAWSRPVEPFHIAGNLYYVGAHDVTSFLFTSPQGHVLLDGGLPETAPMIAKNIERLGFEMKDVRLLLNSHAHFDHAGGLASLKEQTGASFAAMKEDVAVLESGRGAFGAFPPVKVDRILRDGDVVGVGSTRLVAHHNPGHTPGCTTWTTKVQGVSRELDAVFVCSPNTLPGQEFEPPAGTALADQYRRTFVSLRSLHVDLFFASHGSFLNLTEKRTRLRKESAESVFVDPDGYKLFVEEKERAFLQKLR